MPLDPDYLGNTMTVLPYGSAIFHAEVGCRSEPEFLACARLDTGDGFIVAEDLYRAYGKALTPHGNG